MFRNIKIIITFVFFLLSSHLYANCSKDDINYYLEKGFSHDQVTKLCSSESKSKKNNTYIGSKSLIGSNSSLIAPVKIGNNVTIGAGSVINKDIPNNKLAVRRSNLKIY